MAYLTLGRVRVALETGDGAPARLLGVSTLAGEANEGQGGWAHRLVEVRVAGDDHDYIESGRAAGTAVGSRLRTDAVERPSAVEIVVRQRDPSTGLRVSSHMRGSDGSGTLETWTVVENAGAAPVTLLSVSSFFLVGMAAGQTATRGGRLEVWTPHSGWFAEFQWQRATAASLGLENGYAFGSRHYDVRSVGPWCSANYLPMGYLENRETGAGLLFEILHSGSWGWQLGDTADDYYLHLGGPTEDTHWWRTLQPGDVLESVHTVVVPTTGGFGAALGELTAWRRRNRVAVITPQGAPVVFNDYMNCLDGDPTEAAVLPLIDAAAEACAEVYCLDAGWYAPPGERWSSLLGLWKVEDRRFPRGLRWLTDQIRAKGMTPGIWFEIEAMTGNHPDFERLPDDWFFIRHGRRVQSHRRFQLDFRNPDVRAFADDAISLAVDDLGCGYLKLDYNLNGGPGTEVGAESWGEGLLDYDRAYLDWLDALRRRHPEVLIEHCASGGLRLCHPFLSRTHNASISDNGNVLEIAPIAAGSMTSILPEQAGVWALPMEAQTDDMTSFAMASAILGRMIIGGTMASLSDDQRSLVAEAVGVHKELRPGIAASTPFWPLGLPQFGSDWIALGLMRQREADLVVWRRGGEPMCRLDLPTGLTKAHLLYPAASRSRWEVVGGRLEISQPAPSAVVIRLSAEGGA